MLKSYEELRKIDVSQWTEKRDGADYLNWAKVIDLLHENGAEKAYFDPIPNANGSSLYMSSEEYIDTKGNKNKVYETAVKIVVDNDEWIQRGPVMNGSNPVKDNSMSQQRLWNCQTRLFVKGIAIRKGLGFDLWLKNEQRNERDNWEDDLNKHNVFKIKERMQEIYTNKIKKGLQPSEIARLLNKTEDEIKAYFTYPDILNNFEIELSKL